jgi:hypothetical protein
MNTPLVVELELSLETLSGIYRMQNWPVDYCEESTPTASDLAELITHVAMNAATKAGDTYVSFGRIVAFEDAEVPGVVELALKIGYARPEMVNPDEPMTGSNFGGDI